MDTQLHTNILRKRRYSKGKFTCLLSFFIIILISIVYLTGVFCTHYLNELAQVPSKDSLEVSPSTEDAIPQSLSIEYEATTTSVISFLAVGDNLIHSGIYKYADSNNGESGDGQYDFLPCYEYMADYISAADLAFINQESIIGGDDLGISSYPTFNSPEQLASDICTLGFDIVNGATNHVLDKGESGVNNTVEIWNQFDNILFSGAYSSQEDADTIKLIEAKGVTIAVLSYTYGTNGIAFPNNYCTNLFDEVSIREDVEQAKSVSDIVIVSAHWGTENDYSTNALQEKYSQLFADLEVDLVIGHHPHIIQSLEWVEGVNGNQTLVAYSLGNFLSTMDTVDTQLEGMLTLDFVVTNGSEVSIENIEWTALINHYNSDEHLVMPLSEYTESLNATHSILSTECPDAITTFKEITDEIIGPNFVINY